MKAEFGYLARRIHPKVDRKPAQRSRYIDGDYSCCYLLKRDPTSANGMIEMMLADEQNPGALRPYSTEECQEELDKCLFTALQHDGRFIVVRTGDYFFIYCVHRGEAWSIGPFDLDAGRILFRSPNDVIGTVMYKTFEDFFYHYRHYFKQLVVCAIISGVGMAQTNWFLLQHTGQRMWQSWEDASKKAAWCSIV